ncbi:MAG: 3-coathanger stack domain-containing protein [Saprospiraceae bacterium]
MNNFFKPILLMMAFAVSMLSFSNESYATCAISGITLASSECTGVDEITAVFTVTYDGGSGAGTYTVGVDVNGGAASNSAVGTNSGTVNVTVTGIPDDDGTLQVTATLSVSYTAGGTCGSSFPSSGTESITGTATGCTGATCDNCMPSGTLAIATDMSGEICNEMDFQAQDITCDGTITGSRTVTFTASNSITLNAGFESNTTGTFTATIGTVNCASLTDEGGEESHRLGVAAANIAVGAAVKVTPNPFSSSASIDYTLETEGQVIIQVFNLKGEPVATLMNATQVAGQHTVNFEAANLPKGFYYLSLQTANERVTEQMVIMR